MQSNDRLQGTQPLEFVREYDVGNDSRGTNALTDQQRGECTVHDVYHILLPLPADPIVCASVLFPVIIWSALLTCHPSVYSPIDVSIKSCAKKMRYHFLIRGRHSSSKLQLFFKIFIYLCRYACPMVNARLIVEAVFFSIVSQCVTKLNNFTRRNVRKCSHDKILVPYDEKIAGQINVTQRPL